MQSHKIAPARPQQKMPNAGNSARSESSESHDDGAVSVELIEALLDERIFPFAHSELDSEPWLTAVDARGTLLVIDACEELNASALTYILAKAGPWSRRGRAELAQLYPGGPQQFTTQLAQFLSEAAQEPVGATAHRIRLVILCSAVTPVASNAVQFLRNTGSAVDVITHSLDNFDGPGHNGQSPNAQSPNAQSPAGQTADGIHRSHASTPDFTSGTEPTSSAATDLESIPVELVPAEFVAGPPAARPGRLRPYAPAAQSLPTATGSSVHAAAFDGPRLRSRVIKEEATITHQIDLSKTRHAQSGSRYAAAMAYDIPVPTVVPVVEESVASSRAGDDYQTSEPRSEHAAPTGPISEKLAALAQQLSEPTALVWTRLRRGKRYEAILDLDGVITLSDGSRYADPDAAAAGAAGSEGQVDGWRVWRAGDDGPSLNELSSQSQP